MTDRPKKIVVEFTEKEARAARLACRYYVVRRPLPGERLAQDRAEKKLAASIRKAVQ